MKLIIILCTFAIIISWGLFLVYDEYQNDDNNE